MTEINKNVLQTRTSMRRILLCVKAGMINLTKNRLYQIFFVFYICLAVYRTLLSCLDAENFIPLSVNIIFSLMFAVLGMFTLFYLFGSPIEAWRIQNNFTRAGIYNSAGETPVLIRKERAPENFDCFLLYFDSIGLTYSWWVDNVERIQNALNVVVGSCEWGKNQHEIILRCASGNFRFPQKAVWKNEYLSSKEGELILGLSATGLKSLNLNIYPHILLAGSTGSGKTVFLHTLIWQCILRKYHVVIADFKGGVDFVSNIWRGKINIVSELDELATMLEGLCMEMELRRNMLLATAFSNIKRYNEHYPCEPFRRKILVIDELAEVLDKSGLTKREKELTDCVERKLSTLIRLGRAMGIHCILATQRPDSEILRGQIRSNIDAKFCSRCDSTLSILLLGDAEASTRIPKNELGLFMGTDKVLFKSFILDEDHME